MTGDGKALATVTGGGETLTTVMERPAEKRWPRFVHGDGGRKGGFLLACLLVW